MLLFKFNLLLILLHVLSIYYVYKIKVHMRGGSIWDLLILGYALMVSKRVFGLFEKVGLITSKPPLYLLMDGFVAPVLISLTIFASAFLAYEEIRKYR